jgi:hypothetical protein
LVARMLLLQYWAFPPTESWFLYDLAGPRLLPATTLVGAFCPLTPATRHTIDRAGMQVAFLCDLKFITCDSSIGCFNKDVTTVRLVTGTTRLGAFFPCCPFGVLAADGTFLSVTCFGFGSSKAWLPFSSRVCHDRPQALLVTLPTSFVTRTPLTPNRKFTVIRARVCVALDFELEQRAFITTIGSLSEHATRAGHHASTASLGAFTPLVPLRHIAVHRALTFVALARFVETRAH